MLLVGGMLGTGREDSAQWWLIAGGVFTLAPILAAALWGWPAVVVGAVARVAVVAVNSGASHVAFAAVASLVLGLVGLRAGALLRALRTGARRASEVTA